MGCLPSVPVAIADGPSRFHSRYRLGSKIGKGGFSQVRSAKKTTDSGNVVKGSEFAVKIIDLRQPNVSFDASQNGGHLKIDARARKDAECEVSVWRHVGKHEFIVPLTSAFMDTGLCYFVMEMCDISLRVFLEQGAGAPELDEGALTTVFSQMLSATSHIHELSVVHRDIKPDNFLAKGGVVKMCDFGFSEILPPNNGSLSGVFGTAPYMCPEMLGGQKYDEKADMWSLGALVYVLLFGEFPYMPVERNAAAMKRCIRDGKTEPAFKPYKVVEGAVASSAATSFVRALLVRDPKLRASANEALRMPFFTKPHDGEAASMSVMLLGATKCGAFENRRTDVNDKVDVLLGMLQQKHQGVVLDLPAVPAQPLDAEVDFKGRPTLPSDCSTNSSISAGATTIDNGSSTKSSSSAWSTGTGALSLVSL